MQLKTTTSGRELLHYFLVNIEMGQSMDVPIDYWGIMSSGEDGSAGSDFRRELPSSLERNRKFTFTYSSLSSKPTQVISH
jgi:hypothetical protein